MPEPPTPHPDAARAAQRDWHLREHTLWLLRGGEAHIGFERAFADLPPELRGARPSSQPFTPWRLLEHMRITQHDILEFSRDPDYKSPPWPEGYWPAEDAPPDDAAWNRSLNVFRKDREAFDRIIADPATDLLAPIPHGTGQTLLREALLIVDHTAYHLGQLVLLRRELGAWG